MLVIGFIVFVAVKSSSPGSLNADIRSMSTTRCPQFTAFLGGIPFHQIEKNLTHPTNWKLKVNYPYPTVQIDGCPSKQYDRVVSYWFRRGDEQFDKLGRV